MKLGEGRLGEGMSSAKHKTVDGMRVVEVVGGGKVEDVEERWWLRIVILKKKRGREEVELDE